MSMKMRFFDFEVFPDWWLCVLGDYEEDCVSEKLKDTFRIISSDMPNGRDLLLNLLKEEGVCIVGYNIKGYDLIIANAIYQGFTPEEIKVVNDLIIRPGSYNESKLHMRLYPFAKKKLKGVVYQDLLDDGSGSLKEKESTLGLDIEESSVDFDKSDLTDEEKEDVIKYCKHDVYSSMEFYEQVVKPYTKTKLAMGKHFNIPEETCHMSTNARLVSMALGAVRTTYSDAERSDIDIPERIKKYCYDNLPLNVLERIRTDIKGFTVKLFDNDVSFGNGGVHSTWVGNYSHAPKLYIESDDDFMLINVDAESYYPSMLIQLGFLSRSVTNPGRFKAIFDERIELKHIENKTEEQDMAQAADKLVLNTTFGASGNKWLDLYDPYQCTRTCRVGQIFLSAFACKIYKTLTTAKIIQTNTDGILLYLARKDLPVLEKLIEEWSGCSGINMEIDYVDKIWQRDVNNYLLVKTDGKVKRKGGWLNDDYYRRGYVNTASANAYVCAKAAQQFLLTGKDPVESIVENTSLQDFTIGCTKGPTYSGVIQRMSDGSEVKLHKANRVIATTDKSYGKLYKVKKYKDRLSYTMMPSTPDNCLLVNKSIKSYDFKEMRKKIDYMYYVERTADLLDIEWYRVDHNRVYRVNDFDYLKD